MQFKLNTIAILGSFALSTSVFAQSTTQNITQNVTQSTGQNRVAQSTQASPLVITLSQKKVVVDSGGKETLSDAKATVPGDIIEYEAVYQNVSKNALRSVGAVLPVPEGMYLLAVNSKPEHVKIESGGSVLESTSLMASFDKVNYDSWPVKVRVKKDAKSAVSFEDAHPLSYKSVKYTASTLAPGAVLSMKVRMRLVPAGAEGAQMDREFKIQQNNKVQ